jgi:pyruvate,water dikinase
MKTGDCAAGGGAEFLEQVFLTEQLPVWFLDGTHSTPPWTPMFSWFWCGPSRGCAHGMQYAADKLSIPTHKGMFDIHLKGCGYMTPTVVKDKEEIRTREAKFKAALTPYIDDFDGLWSGYRDELVGMYKSLQAVDLDSCSLNELEQQWRSTEDMCRRMWEIHWLMFDVAMNCWVLFQDITTNLFGIDQASPEFQKATTGFQSKAFQIDKRQWELGQDAFRKGIADVFSGEASQVIPQLEKTEAGREWLKDFRAFLEEDGWRAGRECEINEPTWIEDPTIPIRNIQSLMKSDGSTSNYKLDILIKDHTREREAAQKALLQKVPDEQRDWFEALLKVAAAAGPFSEEHGHYCEFWAHAMIRRCCLAIGRRFVKAGAMDKAEDIFFLNGDEVYNGIFCPEYLNIRSIVNQRRKDWEQWCQEEHPPIIGNVSQEEAMAFMLSAKDPCVMECGFGRLPQAKEDLKADLYGIPVSAGVAEGLARKVNTVTQLIEVQPDEILVCPVADPSWTAVFSLIKGVVASQGGALHHAAIMGREFGIPVVSNVFGEIKKIKTGQRIRVDGNLGVVYILDK